MRQKNTKQPLDFDGDRWPLPDSAFILASIYRRNETDVLLLVNWWTGEIVIVGYFTLSPSVKVTDVLSY